MLVQAYFTFITGLRVVEGDGAWSHHHKNSSSQMGFIAQSFDHSGLRMTRIGAGSATHRSRRILIGAPGQEFPPSQDEGNVDIRESPAGDRNRNPLQQSMDMIFGDLWHVGNGLAPSKNDLGLQFFLAPRHSSFQCISSTLFLIIIFRLLLSSFTMMV